MDSIANLGGQATVRCFWTHWAQVMIAGAANTEFKSVPSFTILQAIWGGQTANTYTNLTDASSFIVTSILSHTEWVTATKTQREAALIQATLDVDSRQYVGGRYYNYQFLEFPRAYTTPYIRDYPQTTQAIDTYDMTRMRESVKRATCHQAIWLLRNSGRNTHAERIALGITSISERTGPVSDTITYNTRGSNKSRLCPEAFTLLSPWRTTKKIYRG